MTERSAEAGGRAPPADGQVSEPLSPWPCKCALHARQVERYSAAGSSNEVTSLFVLVLKETASQNAQPKADRSGRLVMDEMRAKGQVCVLLSPVPPLSHLSVCQGHAARSWLCFRSRHVFTWYD